jgi:hypothetical protein
MAPGLVAFTATKLRSAANAVNADVCRGFLPTCGSAENNGRGGHSTLPHSVAFCAYQKILPLRSCEPLESPNPARLAKTCIVFG